MAPDDSTYLCKRIPDPVMRNLPIAEGTITGRTGSPDGGGNLPITTVSSGMITSKLLVLGEAYDISIFAIS